MAEFLQSPGIQVSEKDASTVVVGASTTVGGTVGTFRWGPVMTPVLIDNEGTLVSTFGQPDQNTFGSFYSANRFLAYANSLWVIRAATGNLNATADGTGLLIKNISDYEEGGFLNGIGTSGTFAARYPGADGNSLLVSIADSGTFSTWAYKDQFTGAPGTSDFAAAKGGSEDELHVIVIDTLGKFTGTPNTVLEKYEYVSKASDAKSFQGLTNYYANVLLQNSQYVYWMDHPTGATDWGTPAAGTAFDVLVDTVTAGYDFSYQLSGGTDDNAATTGELSLAWDIFANTDLYDISLFFVGNVSTEVSKYVVDNIGEVRRDCTVFVTATKTDGSPIKSTSTTALADAIAFKTAIGNSTYTVIDSGYAYMYDKYNDQYRWVATNADIAGLCARVDSTQDTWMSPAGLTKGQIKNVVKLAWNPTRAQRDELYKNAINPVVTLVGQGTLLYGDKTATTKPSAFDRINVRRLFLILEKTISNFAKYQLFELNDTITRQQFIAAVEPFLRDVQGRRGIDAFKVICDETNNGPSVVAANEFRGNILVRPRYSINFVSLTFTAVGPAVTFETAASV